MLLHFFDPDLVLQSATLNEFHLALCHLAHRVVDVLVLLPYLQLFVLHLPLLGLDPSLVLLVDQPLAFLAQFELQLALDLRLLELVRNLLLLTHHFLGDLVFSLLLARCLLHGYVVLLDVATAHILLELPLHQLKLLDSFSLLL